MTKSLPSRERGLKCAAEDLCGTRLGSLPSRERGLKLDVAVERGLGDVSLPSRERGLKFEDGNILTTFVPVAPFTGAWIEISKAK